MLTLSLLLMLVAVILWFLAAFNVTTRFNLVAAGLALFGTAYLLGPLGLG